MTTGSDDWRGIFPAICTPFTPDDDVDVDAQRRVVRFVLEAGVHGIVCFGLAGEVLKLTAAERERLTDAILEEVDGRVPVLIGAGGESLTVSRRLARYAERAGASAIVVPAPVTAQPGDDGLVDYFARVASEVALPVMIQDAPMYLGVRLGAGLVRRVRQSAANVSLVKLEAGPAEMTDWLEGLGDEVSVWGGDGGVYQLDCLRIGAAGIVPGADLVDRLVEIYEAEARAETETADALFRQVLPALVFEMQSIDHYNACAKEVLRRRGVLRHTALRPPARPLPASSLQLLDGHVASLDLRDVAGHSAA